VIFRRLPPPTVPRAARARVAVDRLLAGALVVGLWAAARDRLCAPGPPAAPLASLPVDLARDGASRLRLLPGLGTVRVRAILADRERRGPLRAPDDLLRLRGIGRKTVDALRAAGAGVAEPGGEEAAR
jgi:competence protein ComEA